MRGGGTAAGCLFQLTARRGDLVKKRRPAPRGGHRPCRRDDPVAGRHAGAVRRRVPRPPDAFELPHGEVTVATLVPMRFVPHRVVAIIGLDDEAFPRNASIQGDDILVLDPCLGERDPRSEDRQLLLDAVMSATDQLLICYTGADPITGMPGATSGSLGSSRPR